jgi:predicted DNA-binding transcriptional regulator AlpA
MLSSDQSNHNNLLRETQVAERYAMSVRALQAWRLAGKGPCWVKLGSAVRYRESDVEAFVEQSLQGASSLSTTRPAGGR